MTLVGLGYLDQQEKKRHNIATEGIDREKILSNERISSLDRTSREKIAKADRTSKENIAKADRGSREDIALKDRLSREDIASLDRESKEGIAKADRLSKESIAEADRLSREDIATKDRTAKSADSRYASDAKLVGQSWLKNAAASAIITDRVQTGDWSSGPIKSSYMKDTTENSINAVSAFLNSFQDAILGKAGRNAKTYLNTDRLTSVYE